MNKMMSFLLIASLIPLTAIAQKFELITPPLMNLGTVPEDTVAEVSIKFQNSGEKPLIIKKIDTSCGCTAAKLDKKSFDAGENGEISVRLNTRGFSGTVRKYVTIHLQEAGLAPSRITLQADVQPKLEIDPRFLDFQNITIDNKRHSRSFQVKNNTKHELVMNEIKSNLETLEIQPSSIKLSPGESQVVEVAFQSQEEGRFTGFILLETEKPSPMAKRIPVFINVKSNN